MRAVAGGALLLLLLAGCPGARSTPRPPRTDVEFSGVLAPGGDLLVDHLDDGRAEPTMSVYLIDVGQGAATLLEFSCGAVLIDAGGEKNPAYDSVPALKAFLEAFFARRRDLERTLELVVFTHPHTDHLRGGDTVLAHFRVKNVVTNGMKTGSAWKAQARFEETARKRGAQIKKVRASAVPPGGLTGPVFDPLACAGVDPEVKVMWGQVARSAVPGWSNAAFDDENNHSVALHVRFGEASLLVTGDLEDEGMEALVQRHGAQLDADILQAGHHGARNGTRRELLDVVTPKIALIPAGPPDREGPFTAWDHGHPNADAVGLLETELIGAASRPAVEIKLGDGKQRFFEHRLTAPIYATSWDGTVHLTVSAGGSIRVRTAR